MHQVIREKLESAAWRILRRSYARLIAKFGGLDVTRMSEAEVSALIDAYLPMLEHDHRMMCALIAQTNTFAVEHMNGLMRSRTNYAEGDEFEDGDLLQQALAFAREHGGSNG